MNTILVSIPPLTSGLFQLQKFDSGKPDDARGLNPTADFRSFPTASLVIGENGRIFGLNPTADFRSFPTSKFPAGEYEIDVQSQSHR